MNYIRPCPSCNIELRIPLDRGILSIRCPNCNYRFSIDPNDPSLLENGNYENKWEFSNPFVKFINSKITIQKIISFLLFSILGIYVLRNCSLEEQSWIESPSPNSNIPSNPHAFPLEDENPEPESAFPSPGTSI